jgi:hypothetical protein
MHCWNWKSRIDCAYCDFKINGMELESNYWNVDYRYVADRRGHEIDRHSYKIVGY